MLLSDFENYTRNVTGPQTATIYSNPVPQFGQDMGPGQGNMQAAFSGYLPQNVDLNSLTVEGMPIEGQSGVMQFTANNFIQQSYSLVPFDDQSETRIMENMLVFVARHIDQKHGMYPIVSIGKLNTVLRNSQILFDDWVAAGDQEAVEFQGYMKEMGEDVLEYYHGLREENDYDGIQELLTTYPNVEKFYAKCKENVYCYQTRFGILHRWNFLGVVLSKAQATSLNQVSMTAASSELYVINVVLGERARVFNYWGTLKNTRVGSKVFLVLKRTDSRNAARNGPFQVFTYSTMKRETVPRNVLRYRQDNKDVYGHQWKLGTVSEHSQLDPHEATRQSALGLSSTEKQSYEACSQLPLMYIQLGI